METLVGIQDVIMAPLLFIAIYIYGSMYSSRKYGGTPMQKHFMNGLVLKMIGSILAGLIFMFYYKKGDTIFYYKRGGYLTDWLFVDPGRYWIMFLPEFFHDRIMNLPLFHPEFLAKENTYMVMRISGILNIFAFNSYFGIAILFSAFSFVGSWKLYKVFYYYYPTLNKEIAISTLYLPSLVIWGSGLFKDTLTFGALGILVYIFHALYIRRRFRGAYLFYGAISFYMIGVIKPYILMALMPSMIFFIINERSAKIGSAFIRTTVFPVVLTLVAVISFGALSVLNTTFTAYNLDNMEEKVEGFQRWHTRRTEQTDGASYSLGTMGSGPVAMLAKFPQAVNVTLFRPYLWESSKPIVLLAALESCFFILVTFQAFRATGVLGLFRIMFTNPFVSFCFVFSLIFAFAVGISSYNFGALVRYKIPCLPFYLMAIYMSRHIYTQRQLGAENSRAY